MLVEEEVWVSSGKRRNKRTGWDLDRAKPGKVEISGWSFGALSSAFGAPTRDHAGFSAAETSSIVHAGISRQPSICNWIYCLLFVAAWSTLKVILSRCGGADSLAGALFNVIGQLDRILKRNEAKP